MAAGPLLGEGLDPEEPSLRRSVAVGAYQLRDVGPRCHRQTHFVFWAKFVLWGPSFWDHWANLKNGAIGPGVHHTAPA